LVALISPSRDLGQDTSSTPGGRGPLSAPRAHRGSSSILVTVVTAPVTARGAVPPARRPKSHRVVWAEAERGTCLPCANGFRPAARHREGGRGTSWRRS